MKKRITDERPACPQCGTRKVVKNGTSRGEQRYWCRHCGVTFHTKPPRYFEAVIKQEALAMYMNGATIRAIAKAFDASPTIVWKWIHSGSGQIAVRLRSLAAQLEQQSDAPRIIPLEKLPHHLKKTQGKSPYALLMAGNEVVWVQMQPTAST